MPSVARGLGLLSATVLAVVLLPGCASGEPGGSAAARSTSAAATSPAPTSSVEASGSAVVSASVSASASAGPATSGRGRYALFFGDSNFVGGGCTPDAQQDMARIAGDQLGYRSVIRGEGGTGFATGNPQFDLPNFLVQVRGGALDMSPAPRLVVIEGGSNDTAGQLTNAARNARRVVRYAQAKYPSAQVVLMGPIDVRAGHGDVLPQVVPLLQHAADVVGVPFLNAYDWLPWRSGPGLVCSDYDHASPAGQQILGKTLAAQLAQLGA